MTLTNVDPGGVCYDDVGYCEGGPAVEEPSEPPTGGPVRTGLMQITDRGGHKSHPAINGNMIVWMEDRSGNYDVCAFGP